MKKKKSKLKIYVKNKKFPFIELECDKKYYEKFIEKMNDNNKFITIVDEMMIDKDLIAYAVFK